MERTVVLQDKILVTCILASIPKANLGKVTASKTTSGYLVKYEIKFPEEISQSIQEFVEIYGKESLEMDVNSLTEKYRFVDGVTRIKINQLKRKSI